MKSLKLIYLVILT